MVMGDKLCSRGRGFGYGGFVSQRHILDGYFFTYVCCKNWTVCLKRSKLNEKEARFGHVFFKKT